MIAGFPLWWVVGISDMLPMFLAIPMALQLARRRPVRTPPGFLAWILFLLCVVASGLMLWLDAAGAVPGGAGARPLVFGYRLSWYLTCTVVLLWAGNLSEEDLPSRTVVRLFGWMFVVTAVGGLAGVLLPSLEFSSVLESVLPRGISGNGFIRPLIHPSTASVQSILGEASPRPTAPFAYANSWGANISVYLPLFVAGWLGRDAGWRRIAAPLVLVLALVPIVFSLNRGLWVSLALAAVVVLLRLAFSGRPVVLLVAAALLAIGALVFVSTPLADLATERIDNPHSNSRRSQLLKLTVESTAQGSPVVGFGGPRDVRGSFASIAGGETPQCPGCSVPPLGTQGQLWLVIFSQGFLGAAAFLVFFARQWAQHWRCRTVIETVGIVILLSFTVQLLIYDTLGLPMYTTMFAIGLMWRAKRSDPLQRDHGSTLAELSGFASRHRVLLGSFVLVGVIGGLGLSLTSPTTYRATVAVLLEPAPVHLDLDGEEPPAEITVDTEASMVFSERSIARAREALELEEDVSIRDRVQVTAPTFTRVLNIEVAGEDPAEVTALADALGDSYLEVRSDYLVQRRDQVLADLRRQLRSGSSGPSDGIEETGDVDPGVSQLYQDELQAAIDSMSEVPSLAGEVLRPAEVVRRDSHPEVPVVSGALLGLVAGLALASIRDRSRTAKVAR